MKEKKRIKLIVLFSTKQTKHKMEKKTTKMSEYKKYCLEKKNFWTNAKKDANKKKKERKEADREKYAKLKPVDPEKSFKLYVDVSFEFELDEDEISPDLSPEELEIEDTDSEMLVVTFDCWETFLTHCNTLHYSRTMKKALAEKTKKKNIEIDSCRIETSRIPDVEQESDVYIKSE